jgi:hypothetical protein
MKSVEFIDLFEMSNIRKSESGLPVNLFVSSGGSVNNQHGPRIKVMVDSATRFDPSNNVSIMLKKDITADDVVGYAVIPNKILDRIRDYINLNYDTLIKYWNDEISTKEMINLLQALPI